MPGPLTEQMMMSSKAEILYKPHRKHSILFNGIFQQSWLHQDYFTILHAFAKLPHIDSLDDTFDVDSIVSQHLLRKEIEGVYIPSMYSIQTSSHYSMKRYRTFTP